VPTKCWF